MNREELIDEFLKYSKELMMILKEEYTDMELKKLIVQTKIALEELKKLNGD